MRLDSVLLPISILAIGVPSAVLSTDAPVVAGEEQAEAPPDTEIELSDAAGTVTSALQGQDGVRIQTLCTHCNSANIQVGGLSQDFVPISLNGYPVLGGLATSMIFSILPADTVAGAKVAKGPGAAQAPASAAGGVIRLTESTPLELPRLDFAGEAGSYDRERGTVRFAGPLGSWVRGSLVAGRETADTVDDDGDGVNDVGAVDRDFTEVRLEFDAGRDHTLDVGFSWIDEENIDGRGAWDAIAPVVDPDNTLPDWTREDALLDRREYRAGWEWKLGKGRSLDLRLLADNRHQTLRSQLTRIPDWLGLDSDMLIDRFVIGEDNQWGAVSYRHPVGVKGVIAAGIEGHDQEVDATNVDPIDVLGGFVIEETAKDIVESRSGFVDFDFKVGSKSNLHVGLRHADLKWGADDIREYRSRSRTLPRGTFSFRPADGWTLKLIAGSSFRAPAPIFSEICCGLDYERNVDTASETGTTVGLEGLFQPSPDLRVTVYAARSEFDDYILKLVGWTGALGGSFLNTIALANVSETRADTAEVALRWIPVPRLTLDGSMGWLEHHNEGDELVPVVLRSLNTINYLPVDRIPYQPMRTGSLSATVSLPRETQLTGQASYTGPMPIQQYEPLLVLDEMLESPGFWLVNFSFRVPLAKELELIGGVDNITDRLQNDLTTPTRDYNWGPLAGRSWRAGLRYSHFGKRR
jgi:outer membrane receptor protein involved in Fe transport